MIDVGAVRGIHRIWLKQANIPAQHQGWGFSDVDLTGYSATVVNRLVGWRAALLKGEVLTKTGKGLLLQGIPGQGKTTLAAVLLNEIALRAPVSLFRPDETRSLPMRPVYFTTYPALLRQQRRLMNLDEGEEWTRLTQITEGIFGEHAAAEWNVSVLCIDDVGKEHTTRSKWAEDTLDELLRARFDLGLPTIVTTNTPLDGGDDVDDWGDAYGAPMASFGHQGFEVVTVANRHGDQRRR